MCSAETLEYDNFAHLSRHEQEGVDFRVSYRHGSSGIAIVAPHGGFVERGTSHLTLAIAGEEHSYYLFEGLKPRLRDNRILHLTSNRFDDPRALEVVSRVKRVVTIHGANQLTVQAVYGGGRDEELKQHIMQTCLAHGVHSEQDPSPTRQGVGVTNICNRGPGGAGVQLEFTSGLRRQMFDPKDANGIRRPNAMLDHVAGIIRKALDTFPL